MRGGDEFVGWGVDRYLTASIIDAINYNTYALVASNSKRKPKAPEPVQRPSSKPRRGRDDSSNPFRQKLEAVKKAKKE